MENIFLVATQFATKVQLKYLTHMFIFEIYFTNYNYKEGVFLVFSH